MIDVLYYQDDLLLIKTHAIMDIPDINMRCRKNGCRVFIKPCYIPINTISGGITFGAFG